MILYHQMGKQKYGNRQSHETEGTATTSRYLPLILTCPHDSCVELCTSLLDELKVWLTAENTHEDVASFLIRGLKSWFTDPYGDEIEIDCSDAALNRTLRATTDLGWFSLLCGYLHTDLVSVQTCYYQQLESRKSGSKWVSSLITKLWHMVHSIWCHRCNHLHES